MKIAICDDCLNDAEQLKRLVNRFFLLKGLQVDLYIFQEADKLLLEMEREPFLIYFLNNYYHKEKKCGIELGRAIKEKWSVASVVFFTSDKNGALGAFELNATHFFLKPATFEKVSAALERCSSRLFNVIDCLEIQYNRQLHRIPLQDIFQIEVLKNSCTIHSMLGDYNYYGALKEINARLPEREFYRCHRSFIVNLNQVKSLGRGFFVMKNEAIIPIRRNDQGVAEQKYMEYLYSHTQHMTTQ